jgi:hypothetical protein
LEYLDDCFKVLREQIKLSQIWENDDMKSTGADHVQKYSWDKAAVPKENKHELEAKIKINTNLIEMRIELTKKYVHSDETTNTTTAATPVTTNPDTAATAAATSIPKSSDAAVVSVVEEVPKLPSIYELTQFYRLDSFEHSVLILLIAHSVAPTIRKLYRFDRCYCIWHTWMDFIDRLFDCN